MSMNEPKQNEMGICRRYGCKSFLTCSRVMNDSSKTTNRRLRRIVHWPIVSGVNMLNTYVTLVMGEVPNNALVIKAMPKALMNSETRNSRLRLTIYLFMFSVVLLKAGVKLVFFALFLTGGSKF